EIVMSWDRRSHRDAGGEIVVALGAGDQQDKTVLGKFSSWISDGALDDLVVAAFDQNVSHGTAQNLSLRDREKMSLALATGILDQHGVIEPVRLCQHGRRDLDQIVEGERLDQLRWRFWNRSQAAGKQSLRGRFNSLDQAM